jgi:DNA polymerase-1
MSYVSALSSMLVALGWKRAWAIDFEFVPHRGSLPDPVTCMAARCLITGEKRSLWLYDKWAPCPFEMADDELFLAHSASAEVSCFIALGWPLPTRVIDTMVEVARVRNGGVVRQLDDEDSVYEPSLLRSLVYFGIPARSAGEKDEMIALVLRGGPYTLREIEDIQAYCATDGDDAAKLIVALFYASDLADSQRFLQAVWRGRCVTALTVVQMTGTPLDIPLVKRFMVHGQAIEDGLVDTFGAEYPGVFKEDRSLDMWGFAEYLSQRKIPWPRTAKTGMPVLDKKIREEQVELHPELKNLSELLTLQARTRLGVGDLEIGLHGRNSTRLRPFTTKTGRCAPSGSGYLYTQSKWVRFFARPPESRALLTFDWKACEIAVAAALSGDEALWDAAVSDDPYIAFGGQLGQSKEEAKVNRPLLKATMLGVQFGMTGHGIATRNKIPIGRAERLLAEHKRIYAKFWLWSLGAAKHACEGSILETRLGWRFGWPPQSRAPVNSRTARNWPVQSTAAEMMRLATVLAIEARLSVCAVIHDAFVVETALRHTERNRNQMLAIMNQASEMVLGEGRRIRVKREVIRYPDRYEEKDGAEMFKTAMRLLAEAEARDFAAVKSLEEV